MNFRRTPRIEEPEINLIPLIDVMLVILIFLMATTAYSRFSELKINLPVAKAKIVQTHLNEMHITISAQNHYLINKKPITFAHPAEFALLLSKAAGLQKNQTIIVAADQHASYQSVITAIEAARLAGFAHLTFSTQLPVL